MCTVVNCRNDGDGATDEAATTRHDAWNDATATRHVNATFSSAVVTGLVYSASSLTVYYHVSGNGIHVVYVMNC